MRSGSIRQKPDWFWSFPILVLTVLGDYSEWATSQWLGRQDSHFIYLQAYSVHSHYRSKFGLCSKHKGVAASGNMSYPRVQGRKTGLSFTGTQETPEHRLVHLAVAREPGARSPTWRAFPLDLVFLYFSLKGLLAKVINVFRIPLSTMFKDIWLLDEDDDIFYRSVYSKPTQSIIAS